MSIEELVREINGILERDVITAYREDCYIETIEDDDDGYITIYDSEKEMRDALDAMLDGMMLYKSIKGQKGEL